MEQENLVKDGKYYKLIISNSIKDKELKNYHVVNKLNGVIEQEFFIMSQALVNMDKMDELLDEYFSKERERLEIPALLRDSKVVSIKDRKDV